MKVLVVEDHEGIRSALLYLFELEGFEAACVDCGEHALTKLEAESYDVVLLDLHTNGISAEDFMNRFRAMQSRPGFVRPAIILLSGSQSIEFQARRLGADHWFQKPFDHEQLLTFIRTHSTTEPLAGSA